MTETTKPTAKKSKPKSSKTDVKGTEKSTAKTAVQANLVTDNFTFEITLPASEVNKGKQTALEKARARLHQNGFRKGKTPDKIVEQAVGQQYLLQQTLETIVPPAYEQALKDKKLQPLTEPEIKPISMEDGKDWTFEVTIANRPVIDVSKYAEIVSKTKSGHDLWKADKSTDSKSKKSAEPKKSAKKAKTDSKDQAEIDNEAENQNANESDDASTKLRQDRLQVLISALLSKIEIPVPDLLLRHETQAQLHELEHQLEHLKMSFDDFLKNSGKTREDVEKDYAARALGNLQVELLLGAIIQAEELKNTEAEIGAVLEQRMSQYPEESRPKITARDVQYVNALLLKQKALDHLLNL